jgi:hypothetical protein
MDEPQRIGQGSAMRDYFQDFATRLYDPEKDPRIVGGEGYVPILCSKCEDEGVVYYSRVDPKGVRYWFLARCSCGARGLPEIARSKIAKDQHDEVTRIPRWDELMERDGFHQLLGLEDLIPMRLHPYASETGVVPFPPPEPLTVEFRRIAEVDPDEVARRDGQLRADRGRNE